VTAYKPRWFTRPQTVTHLAVHGRESNSPLPVDHKSDALTMPPGGVVSIITRNDKAK